MFSRLTPLLADGLADVLDGGGHRMQAEHHAAVVERQLNRIADRSPSPGGQDLDDLLEPARLATLHARAGAQWVP